MRRILLIIFFGCFFQTAFGQINLDSCNSLIGRRLRHDLESSGYDSIDFSGLTFIKISKVKDSLILKSIFYSAPQFNLETNRHLIHVLNRDCKTKLPEKYEVFIPVYFNIYYKGDSLVPYHTGSTDILEKKIKEYKGRNVSMPVITVIYQMRH